MQTKSIRTRRLAALAISTVLLAGACGSSAPVGVPGAGSSDAETETTLADPSIDSTDTTATSDSAAGESAIDATSTTTDAAAAEAETIEPGDTGESAEPLPATLQCAATAAEFVTRGSANPDLEDPVVEATCDGDTIVVFTNAVPDYTYIGTSPGFPGGRDATYTLPATPVLAETTTAIPYVGELGLTLGGIPIFGPTEGTGGDVDSLPGILSACGSHNGPSGFHIHKILSSTETDCLFAPEEVADDHQLVGYAYDGFPIYTGIDQFTSSWQLTDETLFATDTWAAHTYVEGSGDLDECNGRVDENGDYAYYTTETFPYVLGCFVGEVELTGPGEGGGDRPERPEGGEGDDRPADGDVDAEGERPERPEPPADGERPERPEGDERPERPEPEDGTERPEPEEGVEPPAPTDEGDA